MAGKISNPKSIDKGDKSGMACQSNRNFVKFDYKFSFLACYHLVLVFFRYKMSRSRIFCQKKNIIKKLHLYAPIREDSTIMQ
jgi:hypothetical protein